MEVNVAGKRSTVATAAWCSVVISSSFQIFGVLTGSYSVFQVSTVFRVLSV